VLKALAERNKINTAEVDDVIWGTSTQRGPAGHATWAAWPRSTPAMTSAPAA
jgi:acetyl-CoA acetyltransferase